MQLVGRGPGDRRGLAPQPQGVDQAAADQGAQAQPQAVAARHRFAVRVQGPWDRPFVDQSLKTNSAELSSAQSRSSTACAAVDLGPVEERHADGRLLVGRQPAVGEQVELLDDLARRCLAAGQPRGAAGVAGDLLVQVRARSSGGAPGRPTCRAVRSQGGSWFGSGRPNVSRNSEGTRCVQIADGPRAGRGGRRTCRARRSRRRSRRAGPRPAAAGGSGGRSSGCRRRSARSARS